MLGEVMVMSVSNTQSVKYVPDPDVDVLLDKFSCSLVKLRMSETSVWYGTQISSCSTSKTWICTAVPTSVPCGAESLCV